MKNIQYSTSQLARAEKVLAVYQLAIDKLSEPQKKIVISYAYARQYLMLYWILFGFCIMSFSVMAYTSYVRTSGKIERSVLKESPDYIIDLGDYGRRCFNEGLSIGMSASCALVMCFLLLILLLTLKSKRQFLDAFLPSLSPQFANEKTPTHQTS
jgi:hypothetical protein